MNTYAREEVLISVRGVSLWSNDINAEDVDPGKKQAAGPDNKLILRDIGFDIRNITRPGVAQGQVAALIGKSGIGKTQLFRILAGLQKPSSGEVLMASAVTPAAMEPVRAGQVGIVPQTYTLFRARTIRSNLALSLGQSREKLTKAEVTERIAAQAEAFNLTDHLSKYPHQLSGGQRQRVSILQQLMAGNHTVLMDEPFSGLDVLMIDKVLGLIQKVSLMDELNTLVIVSHDLENALAISDTAFIMAMQPGEPLPDGTPTVASGATLVKEIDLAAMGLAFDPGIRDRAEFREVLREVKATL